MARSFAMAVLMVLLGAGVSHAQSSERLTLVIFNQVTEAVHVYVQKARFLEGTKALDGRVVLIERPRTAASFRVLSEGECAADPAVRLHITLTDLAGGTIGTVALEGTVEDMTLSAHSAMQSFVCTQVERSGPASAPVFTARFQICPS